MRAVTKTSILQLECVAWEQKAWTEIHDMAIPMRSWRLQGQFTVALELLRPL